MTTEEMKAIWLLNNKILNCDETKDDSNVLTRDTIAIDWNGNINRKTTKRKLKLLLSKKPS